ncbi:MAG: hypothetical protein ABI442_03850, partial [Gemmatimonadaceae bacterium]
MLVASFAAQPTARAQKPALTVTSNGADGSPESWVLVPFTIVNNTAASQTVWFSATCSSALWDQWDFDDDPRDHGECLPDSYYAVLAPNASTNVSVGVWIGSMSSSSTVTLTAAANTSSSGTGIIYIPRRTKFSDLAVMPHGGTLTVTPNTVYTIYFSLNNKWSREFWGEIALDCDGFISQPCGWFRTSTDPIYDNHGWYVFGLHPAPDSIRAQFSFFTGPPGTHGNMKVITRMPDPNTGAMAYDTATFIVRSGDQLLPNVTPKSAARTVAPRIARTDTFTVINTGLLTANYTFAPDCGTFATTGGGCTANPASKALAPNEILKVGVTYLPSATSGTRAIIKLLATSEIQGVAPQSDEGSLLVTAIDTSPPKIVVSPSAGATLPSQRFTATVNVCDDGLLSNPIVKFNGVAQPDMFRRAPVSGCMSAGSSTFALTATPGINTIQVVESDGYNVDTLTRTFSYDDAVEVAPRVSSLFDAGAYASLKVPLATAWADTFFVANPGPVAATYTLTAACSTFAGCTTPASVNVAAGSFVKVFISYLSPAVAGQSSSVQLTASHTSVTGHTTTSVASITEITAAGAVPSIAISPATGTSVTTASISASVAWCDTDDAIVSRRVSLGNVFLPDAFVSAPATGCVSGGTSTWSNITLQPWDQDIIAFATDAAGHVSRVSHTVRFIPAIAAFTPQVTPKNTARSVPRDAISSQTFTITNAGAYPATYQLTPSCGTYSVCVGDKTSVTLTPGARDSTHVSFLAPSLIATYAPIRVVARYTGPDGSTIADSADVTMHTLTAAELYQPKVTGGYDLGVIAPSSILGMTYVVQNLGSEDVNYWLLGQTTGGMTFTTPPPTRLLVAAGSVAYVGTSASVPAAAGAAGNASLVAFYTAPDNTVVQSTSTFIVRAGSGGAATPFVAVSVSPHSSQPATPPNADIVQHFDVNNVGTMASKFRYSVACSGGATCPARTDSTALLNPTQ